MICDAVANIFNLFLLIFESLGNRKNQNKYSFGFSGGGSYFFIKIKLIFING
jgi:hypothetical protein